MLNVLGIGHAHPANLIDNKFIEALDIGTSEEWILEKIGIETRLSTLPLDYIRETRNIDPRAAIEAASHSPTDLGVEAVHMALNRAGIKVEDIGLVIANCPTPRQTTPSEAQRIAGRLGLHVPAFDIFTACPVFALHCDVLNSFREERLPEFVLGISTGTVTQKVNYNDRSDSAIWGDGAAAYVLSTRHPGKLSILSTFYNTDPTRCDAVVVDTFKHFYQDGRAVRGFSVRQTVRLLKELENTKGLNWERDVFIGHQANATMLSQICNNRGISPNNHWLNVTKIGNQAGAGAPATISMHWDQIQTGQRIAVAVVGAGLSWGSVLLEGN